MSEQNKCPLLPNTTSIPNYFLDVLMSKLSDVQFKVLMVIARKTYGWRKESDKISKSQFCKMTGFSADAIRVALKYLEKNKIIIKQSSKKSHSGNDINNYSVNILYEEEKGGFYGCHPPLQASPPSPCQQAHPLPLPASPTKTKPVTKATSARSNDKGKSLPPTDTGKVNGNGHDATKYPLKKNQIPIYEYLIGLNLETEDETLKVLVRMESEKKLKSAGFHFLQFLKTGKSFKKSKIAYFRSLLKKDFLVDENAEPNTQRAKEIIDLYHLQGFRFGDKFIIHDPSRRDLPLCGIELNEFTTRFYNTFHHLMSE